MPKIHLLTLCDDFVSNGESHPNRALDRVMQRSTYCAQFSPGKVVELWPGCFYYEKALWPYPGAGIVAGCLNKRDCTPVYGGPFVKSGKDPALEKQIKTLMQDFDWALFSYHTTHGYENSTFVTTDEAIIAVLLEGRDRTMLLGHYRGAPPMLPHMQNMTFYDGGEEGLLPYELARERGEPPPLILTAVEPDEPERNRRWLVEQYDREQFDWYAEPHSRLEQLGEFKVFALGRNVLYRVHRITDFDAYMKLWAQCNYSWAIAEAVLSADCDLAALQKALSAMNGVSITRLPDSIATWMYSLSYGGAEHEHTALFHSRDASITHHVWQKVGKNRISRF